MDETFNELEFFYTSKDDGSETTIITLEEKQYPSLSKSTAKVDEATKDKVAILSQPEK